MDNAPAHKHKRINSGVPKRAARRLAKLAPTSTPIAGIAAITPMAKEP